MAIGLLANVATQINFLFYSQKSGRQTKKGVRREENGKGVLVDRDRVRFRPEYIDGFRPECRNGRLLFQSYCGLTGFNLTLSANDTLHDFLSSYSAVDLVCADIVVDHFVRS